MGEEDDIELGVPDEKVCERARLRVHIPVEEITGVSDGFVSMVAATGCDVAPVLELPHEGPGADGALVDASRFN